MAKRSCIGSGRISTPGSHAPWRPFRSWSSGTVCSPTHRASYPFRSLRLVCKILMLLLGLSETNTIGYIRCCEALTRQPALPVEHYHDVRADRVSCGCHGVSSAYIPATARYMSAHGPLSLAGERDQGGTRLG